MADRAGALRQANGFWRIDEACTGSVDTAWAQQTFHDGRSIRLLQAQTNPATSFEPSTMQCHPTLSFICVAGPWPGIARKAPHKIL
jgi:hypothetical protein